MDKIERAYIMAAGEGKRMKGDAVSKPLTMVGGKHLIEYGLEALEDYGVSHICIIYAEASKDIPKLKERFPHVSFRKQEKVNGSLSTLGFLGEFAQTPFLLLDADIIITKDSFSKMLRSISGREGLDAYFAAVRESTFPNARSLRVENGMVCEFRKKGFEDVGENDYQGGMIYLWFNFPRREIQRWLEECKSSMAEFLEDTVRRQRIGAMFVDTLWDVDTPEDVKESERLLRRLGY